MLRRFVKAAKKIRFALEGGLKHAPSCNKAKCDCGLSDLVCALNDYETIIDDTEERNMTLREAIKECLGNQVYEALVKSRQGNPTILKLAAFECFIHEQRQEIEDCIRAGSIFLHETGLMPPLDAHTNI